MSKEAYLLRHFEDEKVHDGKRDSSIVSLDSQQVLDISNDILKSLDSTNNKGLVIMTSPLKRSVETTELVVNRMSIIRPDVCIETQFDERLSALRHGIYANTDKISLELAERAAWKGFVDQTFVNGNMLYRHGDPLISGGLPTYPNLVCKFTKYGENQLEFTIRTYAFLCETLTKFEDFHDKGKMVVISSHMAPLMRIGELLSLSKEGLPPIKGRYFHPGTMYLEEWNQIDNLRKSSEIHKIMQPGSGVLVNLQDLIAYLPALDSELAFLEALAMQVD